MNDTDDINNTEPEPGYFENLTLENFIFLCSPLTLALNAFVLLIVFRYIKYNVRFEQLYVINLTVSDFLFGLVFMTTAKVHLNMPWWFCRPFYVIIWSSRIASVMFLLLLNIHKLVTLFYPLHSMIFMSKQRVVSQIIVCWAVILCISSVYATEALVVKTVDDSTVSCAVVTHPIFYMCMVIFFYILPLTMSLGISICIFVLAQKKARKCCNVSKERRKFCKRILFVFTSTVWTAVTCIPYRVTTMKVQLCRSLNKQFWSYGRSVEEEFNNSTSTDENIIDPFLNSSLFFDQTSVIVKASYSLPKDPYYCIADVLELIKIFQVLLIIGAVVNPLITVATQKRYRMGARLIWRSILRRRNGYNVTNLNRVNAKKLNDTAF